MSGQARLPAGHARDAGDVVITAELDRRPSRPPDHEAENLALRGLAGTMAGEPGLLLQAVAEAAMSLTRAGSAGISLLERDGQQEVFRWVAASGVMASHRGGTLPAGASPCSEALARDEVLLMREPGRAFPACFEVGPDIREALYAPFHADGRPAGVLWAVRHDRDAGFEREDARLLENLARFAAAAHGMARALLGSRAADERSRAELAARLADAELLQRLSAGLVSGQEPGALHEQALAAAMALMRADAASLQVLEPDGERLRLLASRNLHPLSVAHWRLVDAGDASACGQSLRTHARLVVEDCETDPVLAGTADLAEFRRSGIRAAQSTPLVARSGRPVGLISTHWRAPWRLAEADLRLLDVLARQLADLIESAAAEATLREGEERQALLLRLSDALRATADPAGIERTAMRMLGEHLGLAHAYCFDVRRDEHGWVHVVERAFQRDPAQPGVVGSHSLRGFGSWMFEGFARGEAVVVADVTAIPALTPAEVGSYRALGVAAFINVPLLKYGEYSAGIGAHDTAPRAWAPGEIALIREVGERTWLAVERTRAEAALRASEAALAADLASAEMLRALAERLVTEENVGTIHDEILAAALAVAGADAGTLQIHDARTGSLALLATRNFPHAVEERFQRVDAGSRTACGVALRTGERTFVDFADDPADAGCALLVGAGFRTALAVPLVSRTGGRLGMLNTHWRAAGYRSDERQLRFLELIARQAADLIEQRQTQAALRASEERQAFLLRLSDDIRAQDGQDAIGALVARRLAEHLRLDRCYLARLYPEEDRVIVGPEYRRPDLAPASGEYRLSDFPEVVRRVQTRTVVFADVAGDPALTESDRAALGAIDIGAFVTAGVRKGDQKVLGALIAVSTVPRAWTPGEVGLVESIAERAWAAVERARTEAALHASEEKYRSLFEAMGQGYAEHEIVRDDAGRAVDIRLLKANRQWELMTGLPRAAMLGGLVSKFVPVLEPSWIETLDRVVRSGEAERFENEVAALGQWYGVHAYPGGGDRFVLLSDDITERKRGEAALRASEERQAFLLKLSDALRSPSDPEAILTQALRVLGEHLKVTRAIFAERDGDDFLVTRDFVDGVPSMVGRYPREAFGQYTSEVYDRSGRVMLCDAPGDPTLSDAEKAQFSAAHIASYAATVLHKEDGISVALAVHHNVARDWTGTDFELIEETAERTWTAIERVRAEAALRESEARLALAFRTLPLGICVIDAVGELVTANEEMRRFLPTGRIPSRDPGRVARWRAWDAGGAPVRPEDFPGARALRGEDAFPGMQLLYCDDDDHETWIEVASAPLRDDGGRVSGAITVVVDVDRLKRSEEAARASEERLRQFGEASQDILWIRDAQTLQWTYLTPAFEAIYGLGREEALTGDNYRGWQDLIVPEDHALAVANIARVRAGERVTFDYRIRRPSDGEVRWLRNTDFPMRDEAGRVTRIGGVGHDVTAVKAMQAAVAASETRLRTLAEGIPQLVWRADADGLWTWCSPQWTGFTGQGQEDSHGSGWLAMVHPDDQAGAMRAWDEARPHGRLDTEFRVRRAADEAWLWHRTLSVPVRGGEGVQSSILEWLGTTTDIDGLKRLQGEQQVLVAELQHRTRNLLALVRNVARRSIGPSPGRDEYDARLAALGRVQGFLSRSAAYAVSLADLVAAELQAAGDDASGRIRVGGPPVDLPGESVQVLALALHELATNAVKYGALSVPGGRLSVAWRTEAQDTEARHPVVEQLVVEWRESGVAMPDGPPARRGYGTELITRALPYQLRARTALEFAHDGVRCRITLPAGAFTRRMDEGESA